jgi:uncharacterized delta-60 repeat protein
MFTPFAFFQNAVVVAAAPAVFTGYYIGGDFTTYATNTNPYFRMVDSTGSISSSFNIGAGFNNAIYSATTQSDGKIIIGGSFASYSGSTKNFIVRLNTNGTADTGSSWNQGVGFNNSVNALAIQSDQKIVVGGAFTSYSGSGATRIARLNVSGTLDTGSSWDSGVSFNALVYAVALQSDQKIIVGGNFTTYSGSSNINRIARLNTNGTLDTTFNPGTNGVDSNVNTIAVQSDQKIIIGGGFTSYSGSTKGYIVRSNTDGTADTGSSWNQGAGFNNFVYNLALQSDQKIIVGGAFSNYSGSNINRIVRLNTNGTIDNTFNVGTGFNSSVYSLGIQSDGKIIVKGVFTAYSGSVANGVVRLNTDGTLDTTFNRNFSINTAAVFGTVLPLSNGSIILGDSFTGNRIGYMTFFNSTGGRTTQSLVDSYGFFSSIFTSISQSDGKIVAGGSFTLYSGSSKGYIVRLNTDGTSDTGSSWNIGTGFNSTINTLATQSDGKIIVGGSFTSYSGSSNINRIARLNTNGTLDTTFNPGTAGANSTVGGVVVQSDGKIVLVGAFTQYSGSTKNSIARANTDGTSDTGSAWNIGTGFAGTASDIVIQSDQKLVVGGLFTTYSGSTANRIARLNTDGTRDTSFNTGTGFDAGVSALALQSDGKIIAGGSFTTYSGSASNNTRIIRLNTNGTKDTTFSSGITGANGTVRSITLEPGTDKIMIGGDFTSYSGSTANRIARLNTNGSVDTTFQPTGSGFNASVQVILPY